jgi:hypothetical protein
VGGVGVRRGRRDARHVVPGDALDFWRVEAVEPDALLRLSAEMKLPGRAWLQFEVQPDGQGSLLRQTAIFEPRGLLGLAYWYALYPLHQRVFAGMLRIARAVQRCRLGRLRQAGVARRGPVSRPPPRRHRVGDGGGRGEQRAPGGVPVVTSTTSRPTRAP